MNRGPAIRVSLALIALALAGFFLLQSGPLGLPQKEQFFVQTESCSLPVTKIREIPKPGSDADIVVFHGLTANKTLMRSLGVSLMPFPGTVFLVDLPGHGNNREPFSFDRAETCAAELVGTLEKRGDIQLDRTVLVGHSMGAGIAIRLADLYPTAATISVSTAMRKVSEGKPAEFVDLELPRRMPVNLLLINGQFDLPMTHEASLRILRAAEGQRHSPRDFAERRAVQWVTIPFATHTSLIVDPRVLSLASRWVRSALPGESYFRRGPSHPFYAGVCGLAALLLLFPTLAGLAHRAFGKPTAAEDFQAQPQAMVPLFWAGAALAAVGLQFKGASLGPLVHMYSGDYLASVLMVSGVILWLCRARLLPQAFPGLNWHFRSVLFAAGLGLATLLVFGAWMSFTLTDVWMNAPRWWRFAVLIPLLLPYFLVEELVLGAGPASGLARWQRFLRFVLLRAMVWLAMVFGLLALHSGEIMMTLLAVYLAAFSIAQRLGSDAVRRRTGSAAAAAILGAILSAWFIAAVFPLT